MPRTTRWDPLLRVTVAIMVLVDLGFLAYWTLIITSALPAQTMFAEYTDPRVAAWNWSFLPLDVGASWSGLFAVRDLHRSMKWHSVSPAVAPRLILSLALTSTAGGLAIAFWAQRGQFDVTWWAPNLVLLVFPLPLLARIVRTGQAVRSKRATPILESAMP